MKRTAQRGRGGRAGRRRGRPRQALALPDVRSALLAAARKLFTGRGFHEVGTREIASAAGVNPAMIHYYFGDKEGLYKAMLGDAIERLVAQATAIAASGSPSSAEGVASSDPPSSAEGAASSDPPSSAEGAASSDPPSLPRRGRGGGSDDGAGPIPELLRLYVGTLLRDPWIPRLMIREVLSDGAPFRKEFIERFASRAATLIPELVRRERLAGRLREDLDPVLTALSLMGMTVFPFLAFPVAREVFGLELSEEFRDRLVAHTAKLFQEGAAARGVEP